MALIPVLTVVLTLATVSGCSQESLYDSVEISPFLRVLKDNGVEGKLDIGAPINEDMEYVATYVISAYTSTRILSFFKFKDAQKAEQNLREAMKNPKMSGQARTGTWMMAATFFPPDEESVSRIKDLFLAHRFD